MNGVMRAAVLHNPGELAVENVKIPTPGENDVLVKVKACGVCGSDVPRILETGTYHFPTIPGHEFGGVVVETGSNVAEDFLGKRVAVIPLIPCRKCKLCQIGQYAQCEHYDFLGSRSNGGFAEYVKVPADNLVVIPDNVDDDAAAFLEPMSVALHVVKNTDIHYGEDVAVFGLGAIGMFIAQWAKAFGAAHVFAMDIDEKKVQLAREIGLKDALCIKDAANIGELEVDAVFEASGSSAAFEQAIRMLRTGGKMGLVGRPVKSLEIRTDIFEKILRSQLTIKGSWSFEFTDFPHHAWSQSLEALSRGIIKTEPLITHRLSLEQTLDAVKIMKNKTEYFNKILVKPEL